MLLGRMKGKKEVLEQNEDWGTLGKRTWSGAIEEGQRLPCWLPKGRVPLTDARPEGRKPLAGARQERQAVPSPG